MCCTRRSFCSGPSVCETACVMKAIRQAGVDGRLFFDIRAHQQATSCLHAAFRPSPALSVPLPILVHMPDKPCVELKKKCLGGLLQYPEQCMLCLACLLLNHSCCILAHGQLCLTRLNSTRRGQRTTSLWQSPQTEDCVVPSTPMSPELYGEWLRSATVGVTMPLSALGKRWGASYRGCLRTKSSCISMS